MGTHCPRCDRCRCSCGVSFAAWLFAVITQACPGYERRSGREQRREQKGRQSGWKCDGNGHGHSFDHKNGLAIPGKRQLQALLAHTRHPFEKVAAFATDVSLTGRFFTAEEALQAGIIDRVAPRGTYMEVARELAAQVAKNPPLGVRSTVRARRHALEQLSRNVLLQVNLAKLHLSEDFAESARAFAEKRPAGPFKGR